MKLWLILGFVVIWSFSGLSSQGNNDSHLVIYKDVDSQVFSELIMERDGLLLDVRTPGEYDQIRIAHAVLIPVQELESRLDEILEYKEKPIYIYCRSGNRSRVASQILLDAGFLEIYNLDKGINHWAQNGFPVDP